MRLTSLPSDLFLTRSSDACATIAIRLVVWDIPNRQCAEIKIRAERRAGELLREMPKHPPGPDKEDRCPNVIDPPKLSELGISGKQSSRWQAIAAIPEKKFEKHVAEMKRSPRRARRRSADR